MARWWRGDDYDSDNDNDTLKYSCHCPVADGTTDIYIYNIYETFMTKTRKVLPMALVDTDISRI